MATKEDPLFSTHWFLTRPQFIHLNESTTEMANTVVSDQLAGMRLYWAIVKALLPPRPPGYDVLCTNKRGKSQWRRTIVPEASPIADPSLLLVIVSKLKGVRGSGIPNPLIEAACAVYSEWTHWFASTKQILDDYAQTDVARVMRDSCIEEFYRKYKINSKISPTHLIQGRMRGLIRRKIHANPFKGEGEMLGTAFNPEQKDTEKKKKVKSSLLRLQLRERHGQAIAAVIPNIVKKYHMEDVSELYEMITYFKRYTRGDLSSKATKEMPELLHLWYLVAKNSNEYLRRLNAMMLYRPEVPALAPLQK